MASGIRAVLPTTFPRLDSVTGERCRDATSATYGRRSFCYANKPGSAPKGRNSLLRGYARWLASFTGESDVCFQCAVRSSLQAVPKKEIIQAMLLDESSEGSDCIIETRNDSEGTEIFDFGLELLADPELFDSTDVPPSLHCVYLVQYHATQLTLILQYDTRFIDDKFADATFARLSEWISTVPSSNVSPEDQEHTKNRLSVLNHPSLHRPPQAYRIHNRDAPDALLHAGFQAAVARFSDRHALHFHYDSSPDEILTYAELDNLSTALAVKLRNIVRIQNGAPTVVPAYMTTSPAFYVSWLAVLKAGFALCPLPTDAPTEQLQGIIEELGSTVVLLNRSRVAGASWDLWDYGDEKLAYWLDVRDFIRSFRTDAKMVLGGKFLPAVSENDLAYVMYTSGSTGKPKGVKIHHLAASCSIASHTKFIPSDFIECGFRWFQFAAPTFDPSIMEIFTTWWTGGTICAAPRDLMLTDPETIINELSTTIMMATPSMASVLRPERIPTLRYLWTMGEKLTPKVIHNFASDSGKSWITGYIPEPQKPHSLANLYGPTEGSINCTIVPDFSASTRGSIIGLPLDTCSIFILEPNQRLPVPVPLGFSGELAIGGPQVSSGYINRPEQTSAAFVTSSQYGHLYRTGDRARIVKTERGELTVEFLGRLTQDQVKLSGRRVELGQIEAVIANAMGVVDVVTTIHQQGNAGQGSEVVVACVVADPAAEQDNVLAECRKVVEASLPHYMSPSHYFFLEKMPRTRSGKSDRKALQAVVAERLDIVFKSDHKPSTPAPLADGLAGTEENKTVKLISDALAAVCNLQASTINPNTSLLSVGLDSLRTVRFLQQIREYGISFLSVSDILNCRTLHDLVSHCISRQRSKEETLLAGAVGLDSLLQDFSNRHIETCAQQLKIPIEDIETVLPTTATQSGMIASFLRSVSKSTDANFGKRYINHSIYYQTAGIDGARVEQAWRKALVRPKILRTVFTPVDDGLAPFGQCVLTPQAQAANVDFAYYSCPSPEAWGETLRRAQADGDASIKLDRPPVRLAVIDSRERTAYVLSLFHGVFDGGSLELLLEEVQDAFLSNSPALRTDIDVSVRRHFTAANDKSTAFWKQRYQYFEPVPFPSVCASKPECMPKDPMVTEVKAKMTLERLLSASKAAAVSPLSVLQAAWLSILHAYTGSQTNVSFGSVVSDRLDEEISSCIGPTFVVIPVSLDLLSTAGKTAGDILVQLTSDNAAALPYHHIPLSALTTKDGALPYDTLLAFQAFDKTTRESSLWDIVEHPPMAHDFAVMIEVWPTQSGALRLRATYSYEHLDPLAVNTMLCQLSDIVDCLCENMDIQFLDAQFAVSSPYQSRHPAHNELETHRLEENLFLHKPFEQHALEHPDDQALLFKHNLDDSYADVHWTYGELDTLAHNFALELTRRFGTVENEPIMICMEKCPELYIAVLGILKAGAGWSPIDPYSPSARQQSIMEQAGGRILLISPTASSVDPAAIPRGVVAMAVDLSFIKDSQPQSKGLNHNKQRDPSHLAYLVWTSGTTGLPKGVPITHKSAAIAMRALARGIPSDVCGGVVRCMQFSQYTFDVFVQDLFYTWNLGGTVISSNRKIMLQSFHELANETHATHAHLTPAFAAAISREKLRTLEVVTMIGEKLTEGVAADWGSNMRAFNTYGPAEATVVSTLRQFTGNSDTYHSSNIGVPLPSIGAYVVSGGDIVMRGGLGELALTGPQLSPGYWKLPDINATKFVWNEKLKQRVYLTGDLVRHLADDTINFVGRNDDLVKLGGIRVELGEIALALRKADPRIETLEVLQCKRNDGLTAVVAFIACSSFRGDASSFESVLTPASKDLMRTVQDHGRTVLPAYMLPSAFLVLPSIPRTASAKVDRAALATAYRSMDMAALETSSEASNGIVWEQEWHRDNQNLLDIISQVSGAVSDSLRPTSSLSGVGIDSIGAIRMVPKINALGFAISIIDVLKCRDLQDLCQLASRSHSAVENSSENKLDSCNARYYDVVSKYICDEDISVIPATILQESLLSESLKDPQAYWSSHSFQLEDNINLSRLKRAWTKVAAHNEALRAAFIAKAMLRLPTNAADDGLSYLQIIYDEPKFQWSEHTVTGPLEEAAKQRVSAIADQCHQSLFRSPPWAVDIFHKERRTVLMLTMHHSVYDGPSLGVLEADVRALYHQRSYLPQRLPFRDAVAARSAMEADSKECVNFWKESLQNVDSETGAVQHLLADERRLNHRIRFLRSSTSFDSLRTTILGLGLSSVATLLRAAWGYIITNYFEVSQLLLAEILSERVADEKLVDVVGPLLSVVPVLFKSQATAMETLAEQESFLKRAWTYRNVRPGTIKSLTNRHGGTHLYPAMFALHPSTDQSSKSSRQLWQRVGDIIDIQVEHPLAFNVWLDSEPEPYFELAIADHVMGEEEQHTLLHQIDALLAAMARQPMANLAALTDGMPRDLVSRTSPRADTRCPPPYDPIYWVEHWAATHPEWKAAEIILKLGPDDHEAVSWSFADLNTHANRVAHMITNEGFAKRMVAMCLGRTLEAYAVVLGILKSNNAYLPIDESLPDERKAFLLKDSNAALVFTSPEHFGGVEIPPDCGMVDVEATKFQQTMSSLNPSNPRQRGRPEDNAYLLYTSGSTGKPKGVLVSRQNLASFVEAQSEFMCDAVPATRELAGRGKYLGLASRAFDVHIGEMFLAWRHGLAAVTGIRSTLLDDLAGTLSSLHISHGSFVPSLLDQSGLCPDDAPDLVFISVGGEKMSPKTKQLWGSHDRVRLINAYGPTEATIGCCSSRVFPSSDVRDIGSPLGDSVAHILVPGTDHYTFRGTPGELCFTGSLIANGYLNRPDAKGFVENFNGQRMYRTGDIVKLTSDDKILFLGRKDDQVKIRGQRTELGEVGEGVRTASEIPLDAVALIVKHPELSRTQLAVFVARSQYSSNRSQEPELVRSDVEELSARLRSACQSSLPAFMVPDLIVPITYIPLSPTSAKADNKFLMKIFESLPMSDLLPRGVEAGGPAINRALTDSEEEVCEIIAKVLSEKLHSVSPSSRVFELGIDSLSAIKLYSRLRAVGYNCGVAEVMKNPSIEQLAETQNHSTGQDIIEREQVRQYLVRLEKAYLRSPSPVQPQDIAAVLPCIPIQEVLVARSLQEDSKHMNAAYVNHIRFEVRADVDKARLLKAWEMLMHDNEILRTCFSIINDKVTQIVLNPEACKISWTLRSKEEAGDTTATEKRVAEEIVSSISTQPPIRLTYLQAQKGDDLLLLSIHHALYDGESLAMMLNDVQSYYDGPPPPPRPRVMPLIEHIIGTNVERAKSHWTSLLTGWERSPLLSDQSRNNVTLESAERRFTKRLTELENKMTSLNVTLATFLQFAFAIAMCQHLKTNDFIFGVVLSGRTVPVEHADEIMAPCITTIPQHVKLDNVQATVSAVLAKLQTSSSTSLEYQHVSPMDIQRWSGADRVLYDCLFSFVRLPVSSPQSTPLLKQENNSITVDYPLAIECEANVASNLLVVRAGFDEMFGSTTDADLLLEKMEIVTDAILTERELTVDSLPVPIEGSSRNAKHNKIFDESRWTQLEQHVRHLLSQFASIPEWNIHKHTAFIHLGIDSISAIRFAKYLREKGLQVSSADIIRYNRLGSLCEYLSSTSFAPEVHEEISTKDQMQDELISALTSHGIENGVACYPCTPLQTGMLAQSLATDGALYMHHHAISCHDSIDLVCLKEAWGSLVADLDILRTTFHWLPTFKSPWVAVVHRDKKPMLREAVVPDPRAYWIQLSLKSDFSGRIENGEPLAGMELVRSEKTTVMILTLHHSLYDGISLGMLYQHLAMRYRQLLPPQVTPFSEAAKAISRNAEQAVKFWVDNVRGYQGVPRSLYSTPGSQTLAARTITTDVASLEMRCSKVDLDVRDVCTVAFGKALACLYGRRDVVFGCVLAARQGQVDDGSNIIGPMFNTVPFRVNLRDKLLANREVTDQARKTHIDSIEFQHASLAEVQKAWRISSPDPNASLLESIFVYSKIDERQSDGSGFFGTPLDADKEPVPSEYGLNFEVEHAWGGVTARASSSVPSSDIEAFLDHFRDAFHDIVDYPDRFATAVPEELRGLPSEMETTAVENGDFFDDRATNRYAETIRAAMAEVAQISAQRIELHSSIYSFGIDSIAAIQIAARCRTAGVRVGVADILGGAVLGRICEIVATKESKLSPNRDLEPKGTSVGLVSIEEEQSALEILGFSREDIEGIVPCLPGQEFHLLSWLQSGRTLYEPAWTYQSTARLDAHRLRQAWQKLQERNVALRTTFAAVGPNRALQVALKPSAANVDTFETYKERRPLLEAVKDRARNEARTPSNLFAVPIRLRLIQAEDGDAIMVYVHHSLYDAWSMPRLISELGLVFEGKDLENLPSFLHFVRHIQTSVPEEEKAFWKNALAGCRGCVIPAPKRPTASLDRTQSFHMAECKLVSVTRLEQICARHEISPTQLVLLAFARALAHETNVSSPLFGFFQLGRSIAFDNIDRLNGPTVNVLPLGLSYVLDRDILENLKGMRRLLSARVPYEQSSMRTAVNAFDPTATQLPFNVYINLLWHKTTETANESSPALFQPLRVGVPTDFSSPVALPGRTAIDDLDTSFLPPSNLFVDIGPGKEGIVMGARADASLLGEDQIRELFTKVGAQIIECADALDS